MHPSEPTSCPHVQFLKFCSQLTGPVACFLIKVKAIFALRRKTNAFVSPYLVTKAGCDSSLCSFPPLFPCPLCCSACALLSRQLEPSMPAAPCQAAAGASPMLNDEQTSRWERAQYKVNVIITPLHPSLRGCSEHCAETTSC